MTDYAAMEIAKELRNLNKILSNIANRQYPNIPVVPYIPNYPIDNGTKPLYPDFNKFYCGDCNNSWGNGKGTTSALR